MDNVRVREMARHLLDDGYFTDEPEAVAAAILLLAYAERLREGPGAPPCTERDTDDGHPST